MPRKAFATLWLSFVVILIIPLLIGCILYYNAARIVRDQENYTRLSMLNQVSRNLDMKLRELNTIAINIATSQNIQGFLSADSQLTEDNRFQIYNIIKGLQPLRYGNDFMKDFFIYFKSSDIIIHSTSMSTPRFFFQYVYTYDDFTFEFWHDTILTGENFDSYLPSMAVHNQNLPYRVITIKQPIPITNRGDPSAMLFILVDEEQLHAMTADLTQQGSVYILDDNNVTIFQSGPSKDFSQISLNALSDSGATSYLTVDGQDYDITSIQSEQTHWRFLYIIPQSAFMENVSQIQTTSVTLAILFLCLGLTTAFLMAYRNYSPIQQIVKMISIRQEGPSVQYANELEFIKNSIANEYTKITQLQKSNNQLNHSNTAFMEKFRKNMLSMKGSFLAELIKGRISDKEIIKNLLELYQIKFISDAFIVILFLFDQPRLTETENQQQSLEVMKHILSYSIEDVLSQHLIAYSTELDGDTVALLINLPHDFQSESSMKKLIALVANVQECLINFQRAYFTVGVGEIQKGIHDINLSCKQAKHALDCRILEGCSRVILFQEISMREKENRKSYFYPINLETQLINCVKVGDFKQCEQILYKIFDENSRARNTDLKLAKCMMFSIINSVLKMLDEIEVKFHDIPGFETDPVEILMRCESLTDIYLKVSSLFDGVCRYINHNKISHNDELKIQIIQYINSFYSDMKLSQSSIADHFDITPQYLSKIFKQMTGQNMVDYINRLRIEKIKILMLNSRNVPVAKISEVVGFGSVRSLDRVFKNLEGITPLEYKLAMQDRKSE